VLVADETEAETIEHLNEAINARDGSALLSIAGEMHYADLAHHYENLDDEERDFFSKPSVPSWRPT
jgi:Mg/Co/Ni transporter MgtE